MANRRIEVHEIRHAIMRMRLGDSDRQIKKAGLMGRSKASELRKLAAEQGWLDVDAPLPPNEVIAQMIKQPRPAITQSLVTPYAVEVLDLIGPFGCRHPSGPCAQVQLLRRVHVCETFP